MPVFVNNLQGKMDLTNSLTQTLEMIVQKALTAGGRNDNPEVTIALVDDAYIKDLNFRFRQIDKPTDVLSFPMEEDGDDDQFFDGDDENILGDIIISVETAERQAKDYDHSFTREMAFLTVHGMFHLLGYDHNTDEERQVMRSHEEEVLSDLQIMR